MKRFAVCRLDNGLVINMTVADDVYEAPYGCQVIEVPEDSPVGVSWTWDGTNFIDPTPQPEN